MTLGEESALSNVWLYHAPVPMAAVEGSDHRVQYVNSAFCVMMGKLADQLVGKPFAEIIPNRAECITLLDQVYRTGKAVNHIEESYRAQNPVFWSYMLSPAIVDELPVGVIVQVTETAQLRKKLPVISEEVALGMSRQQGLTDASQKLNGKLLLEISERRQTEKALRTAEERYRSLFNSIDEGFSVIEMIFDPRGQPIDYRFLEINPAFEQQSGLPGALGKLMRELVPNHEALWFSTYGNVALTGQPIRFENEAKAMQRWFDVYAFPIGDPAKRRVAVLFTNITKRKQVEESLRLAQLQLSDRAGQLHALVFERTRELTATTSQLETFVYSIAHDLRAPLRAMQAFSQLLVEEVGATLNETGRSYAARIDKAAQFMDAMLRDLLEFSFVSQRQVALVPVNLDSVVAQVLSRLEEDLREKNSCIENSGPWPQVMAHQQTLTQVLFNLVANAAKFVPPGATPVIRLWSAEYGDFIRVWVEDNGVGIAPEHHNQICGLFTRLDGEKYLGTGVGLAIVRKGIERMGGRLGVESTLGQGSRFWFELRKP